MDRVIGVAALLENGEGGDLHCWNISPDDPTREALGFRRQNLAVYDSVGYPVESLAEFQKITVPVRTGDIYIFASSNVHAVGPKADDAKNRTNVLWSMGFLDPTTVLHWA